MVTQTKTLQAGQSILLPPLPEQRAIAAVLDFIDEAIERTEEVIAATERLRDALLHELLTRGVPGQHSEWKEAPGIGTIPACWDAVRLGDVARGTDGASRKPECLSRAGSGLELPCLSVCNLSEMDILTCPILRRICSTSVDEGFSRY